MNKDTEIDLFDEGLNKMYEWLRIALFEAEVPSNLQEKITKRIAALRAEK
jgi:hypothetical protein